MYCLKAVNYAVFSVENKKKIIKKKNILIVLKGTVHVKLWNKFQFFFLFWVIFFSVFNFTILVKGVGSLKIHKIFNNNFLSVKVRY